VEEAGELRRGKESRFGMRYEFGIKLRYVDLRLGEGRSLDLSFQVLDLFLDFLPHMTMEGEGQFTKGACQDCPFFQLCQWVFSLPPTDRARKR